MTVTYRLEWREKGLSNEGYAHGITIEEVIGLLKALGYSDNLIKIVCKFGKYNGTFDWISVTRIDGREWIPHE